jgi:hypothetical protein
VGETGGDRNHDLSRRRLHGVLTDRSLRDRLAELALRISTAGRGVTADRVADKPESTAEARAGLDGRRTIAP